MAHHTEQVGFPEIPINAGMRIRIRALSATTDAAVTGVTWSQFLVYGRDKSELAGGLLSDEVPRWTPEEVV